jgi:hypothetical protein
MRHFALVAEPVSEMYAGNLLPCTVFSITKKAGKIQGHGNENQTLGKEVSSVT